MTALCDGRFMFINERGQLYLENDHHRNTFSLLYGSSTLAFAHNEALALTAVLCPADNLLEGGSRVRSQQLPTPPPPPHLDSTEPRLLLRLYKFAHNELTDLLVETAISCTRKPTTQTASSSVALLALRMMWVGNKYIVVGSASGSTFTTVLRYSARTFVHEVELSDVSPCAMLGMLAVLGSKDAATKGGDRVSSKNNTCSSRSSAAPADTAAADKLTLWDLHHGKVHERYSLPVRRTRSRRHASRKSKKSKEKEDNQTENEASVGRRTKDDDEEENLTGHCCIDLACSGCFGFALYDDDGVHGLYVSSSGMRKTTPLLTEFMTFGPRVHSVLVKEEQQAHAPDRKGMHRCDDVEHCCYCDAHANHSAQPQRHCGDRKIILGAKSGNSSEDARAAPRRHIVLAAALSCTFVVVALSSFSGVTSTSCQSTSTRSRGARVVKYKYIKAESRLQPVGEMWVRTASDGTSPKEAVVTLIALSRSRALVQTCLPASSESDSTLLSSSSFSSSVHSAGHGQRDGAGKVTYQVVSLEFAPMGESGKQSGPTSETHSVRNNSIRTADTGTSGTDQIGSTLRNAAEAVEFSVAASDALCESVDQSSAVNSTSVESTAFAAEGSRVSAQSSGTRRVVHATRCNAQATMYRCVVRTVHPVWTWVSSVYKPQQPFSSSTDTAVKHSTEAETQQENGKTRHFSLRYRSHTAWYVLLGGAACCSAAAAARYMAQPH